MATPRPVIMLEFNELVPSLIGELMAEGDLPNFARLSSSSYRAITDPEEPQENLEPWIQWVTVHTGRSFGEHGIRTLGEGSGLGVETIAGMLGRQGIPSWICGSMNIPRRPRQQGPSLPDPWSTHPDPEPAELAAFSDLVRTAVQEHTNAQARLDRRKVTAFGALVARRGLRLSSLAFGLDQLVAERRHRRGVWGRAAVLDRLQWDLFRWHYRRTRPAFSTFFSNSTAHFQHVYWRHHDPDAFEVKPGPAEMQKHRGAVRSGYRWMDRLLGEAMQLAGTEGTVILCTALSQQPYVLAEATGGKHIYRPHRLDDVIGVLGVEGVTTVSPVMAEQFHLFFADEPSAIAAQQRLDRATIDGRPAFTTRRTGTDVFTGCRVHDDLEPGVTLDVEGRSIPFLDFFYRSETPKSGYHHPDGVLWIRLPGGAGVELDRRVSLREIAPTVLGLLGVDPDPGLMPVMPEMAERLRDHAWAG